MNELYPPAVSCPSAGSCSAAGSYYDNSTGLQGLLLTEAAASWATGVEALPANPPSNGVPGPGFLNSVSCASPGNCGALVTGENLLTESAGSWATGMEPSLPANAAAGSAGLLYSVSCGAAGNCSAVGQYGDNAGREGGLLIGGYPALVTLNIAKNGTGSGFVSSGTVSSAPAAIDCGQTCSASFDAGSSPTLTATPSRDSRFSGWSGGGCGSGITCQPNTGISKQTVTATFGLLPQCVVPKLQRKPLRAAKTAIRTHNCALGKIKYATSRTIKKGHVISQKPKHGRRLQHGAKVSLLVSKGKR